MATGCLSLPKAPDVAGRRPVRRRGVLHAQLAARGRRLHRQARRGDRHRVVGDPVDPDHRQPGVAAHRVPAHAELLDPGPQRPTPRGASQADYEADPRGVPRAGPLVARRRADGRSEHGQRARRVATRSARRRTRRCGRRANCCASAPTSTTSSSNAEANETVGEFVRDKIRSIVDDPETAEALCPKTHYIVTKRTCLDTNYYETYNLPHVRLVDLRKTPIDTVTETGHRHDGRDRSSSTPSCIATGFDAMTGAIVSVDITGRDGVTLEGQVGGGPRDLSRSDDGRVPELLHDHRAREPVGAVEHGGVDRAARRVDQRLPRRSARRRVRHDRTHRRPPRRDG